MPQSASSTAFAPEIWAAVPTPFLASGAVDCDGIRRNLTHYRACRLAGVYCNGIMGEGPSLSLDERRLILETLTEELDGGLRVTVVTSCRTVEDTISLTRHAQAVGADYAALSVPPAGTVTLAEQIAYVDRIVQAVDMRYAIFDSGTAECSALHPGLISHLASRPSIELVKTPAIDTLVRELSTGSGLRLVDPVEENFARNISEHHQCWLYADPEGYLFQGQDRQPIADYARLLMRGDSAAADAVSSGLDGLRSIYRRWILEPMRAGSSPVPALTAWCNILGMATGPVRPPLAPLAPTEYIRLAAELKRSRVTGT